MSCESATDYVHSGPTGDSHTCCLGSFIEVCLAFLSPFDLYGLSAVGCRLSAGFEVLPLPSHSSCGWMGAPRYRHSTPPCARTPKCAEWDQNKWLSQPPRGEKGIGVGLQKRSRANPRTSVSTPQCQCNGRLCLPAGSLIWGGGNFRSRWARSHRNFLRHQGLWCAMAPKT